MNKIPAISISMILLISILLPVASACGESDGFTAAVDHDCIDLEKAIKDGDNWVNECATLPGEVIRFRITVTYRDVDGPDGIGYMLKNITIVDTMPEGLIYLGNSTHPDSVDGQVITWEFDDELYDGDSVSVEFDAQATFLYCSYENLAEVFAFETCYHQDRYDNTTATVIPECITCDKYMDVDDDDVDEEAHDSNQDLDDGFEEYVDPNDNSDDVVNIDGDDDGKIDHFIDIFDKGDTADKYWDPDDEFICDVIIEDVDYDGTDEWIYDSDDDGENDHYYDPDDEKIYPYDAHKLTVTLFGQGKIHVLVENGYTTVFGDDGADFQLNIYQLKFLDGWKVNLTAEADESFVFDSWSKDVVSNESTITLNMTDEKDIIANFKPKSNGNLSVEITKPEENSLYLLNIRLKDLENKTEIIGPINVKVKIEGGSEVEKVEFKLDGEVKKTDTRGPMYNWWWLFKPRDDKETFTIKVVAYDVGGNVSSDSITVTRSAFTPFRDHKNLSLLLLSLGATFLTIRALKPGDSGDGDDDGDGPHVEPDTEAAPRVDAGGPYGGKVGKAVAFDGSNTIDPNDDDLTFVWKFGDGETGQGEKIKHTYDKPGKYTVTLTVTDETGRSSQDTTTVEISESSAGDSDDDKGDEGVLFWYILTALGIAMAAAIGLLYFRRSIYV